MMDRPGYKVPGTFRAHQTLTFEAVWANGTLNELARDTNIGETHGLNDGKIVIRDTAKPHVNRLALSRDPDTGVVDVRMHMQVTIPATAVSRVTPDIDWRLHMIVGADSHSAQAAFEFTTMRFPSYALYVTIDGRTRLRWWKDVSEVDPESVTTIGKRLVTWDQASSKFNFAPPVSE